MTGETYKYSISWAESIISKLIEAHARATEVVVKELGITPHQLAIYLALGRKEYYLLREAIRKLDKSLSVLPWEYSRTTLDILTTRMLSDLLRMADENALDGFKKYLTDRGAR